MSSFSIPEIWDCQNVDPAELYGGKDVEEAAKIFSGILEGKGKQSPE